MLVDLSSGHDDSRESLVAERPTVPFWSENLLFALYDPDTDLGFWLHLGTEPTQWNLWEDRVFVMLPGNEGVMSMTGHHQTVPECRPAASCLAFECLEPFRRWHVTFDGFGRPTTNQEMAQGRCQMGLRERLIIDFDVECATPVWDAHDAAGLDTGKGAMRAQGGAKEHYEQLVRASGSVVVGEREFHFNGTGWRDHSRGPRGGGTGAPWGGHVIQGCLFPSGKGFGFSRYWTPTGEISLEGGYVVGADGVLHHAEVMAAPRLKTLQMSDETLPVALRWEGGELALSWQTTRSLWIAMRKGFVVGADLSDEGVVYALNFGPVSWDGETGWLYSERSDALNALAPDVHPARG